MDSNRGQNGIQLLLAAEQEAQHIVNAARNENSKEMEKALKFLRGEGAELQVRFDCIMQAVLDRKDVIEMVKQAPQILIIRKRRFSK